MSVGIQKKSTGNLVAFPGAVSHKTWPPLDLRALNLFLMLMEVCKLNLALNFMKLFSLHFTGTVSLKPSVLGIST